MIYKNTIVKLSSVLEYEDRQLIIEKIQYWINLLEVYANKQYQHLQINTIMDYNGIYDEITANSLTKAALDYIESTK